LLFFKRKPELKNAAFPTLLQFIIISINIVVIFVVAANTAGRNVLTRLYYSLVVQPVATHCTD
jgi:hypothetical protein